MERKPNFMDKVARFVTGNGFYLVLVICVAAIGISGYFLVRSVMDGVEVSAPVTEVPKQDESQAAMNSQPMPSDPVMRPTVNAEKEAVLDPVPADAEVLKPAPSAEPTPSPSPVPAQSPKPEKKPAPLVFTRPVNGLVIASYSVEALAYDETMLDWRVHEGIDLSAALGTRVLCAAAGVVTEVYQDDLMGATVVVDHGDGLVSVYANLEEMPPVQAGEKVYTGDLLGAVGNTASAESGRQPHLHFAMYRDGVPVDPEEYLPD